jgi:hypothetical protein
MHIKKLIIFLIFSIHSNAMSLEIPIFTTKYFGEIFKQGYKNKEQCLRFTEKIDGQLHFVENICNSIYSGKATEVANKRLLCMRRGIEDASSTPTSRLVIFKCYENFPSDKTQAIDRAKYYFPTAEEIINNQIQINNLNKLKPKRPSFFDCFAYGSYIDCVQFP